MGMGRSGRRAGGNAVARTTAWVRLLAPSFFVAAFRCMTTVGTERSMMREISLAEKPSARMAQAFALPLGQAALPTLCARVSKSE